MEKLIDKYSAQREGVFSAFANLWFRQPIGSKLGIFYGECAKVLTPASSTVLKSIDK